MICELCGKETERTRTIYIEGTKLNVCAECARFGDPETRDEGKIGPKPQIVQRLERRERRMRSKDVYGQEESLELAEDYPQRIRQARMSRDWKQETLASKINEKKSVINKLESGDMRPNDELVAKLERTLGIKLKEKISLAKPEVKQAYSKGLTLGDFVKAEK
jgi:putative transcription factor